MPRRAGLVGLPRRHRVQSDTCSVLAPESVAVVHIGHVAGEPVGDPLMGYAMSSSYSQSDGVPFFFFDLPELLGKNDKAFSIFAWAHKITAYSLLALISLHVLAVIKHRFFDRGRDTDVLSRMI
jgi:Prokaryotic cytochrome b561